MNARYLMSVLLALALVTAGCGDKDKKDGPAVAKDGDKTESSDANSTDSKGPFEEEQGMVEMKMEMMGMPATMTLYFDDYGRRQATYVSMEMMGKKMETATLMEGGFTTTWEADSKTGKKVKSDGSNGGPLELIAGLTDERKKTLNYKEIDSREILGHNATGFSIDSGGAKMNVWHWKGIPLLMEVNASQMKMTITATKLDTDTDVPDDKFTIPADVKISEGSEGAVSGSGTGSKPEGADTGK